MVIGTLRDTLHFLDVVFSQDGGQRPDILVTGIASYADRTFGYT